LHKQQKIQRGHPGADMVAAIFDLRPIPLFYWFRRLCAMKHHRAKPAQRAQGERSGAKPREVEVKFAVPDNVVQVLAEHLASKTPTSDGVRHRHEVTTYFDTSDRALARSGMSVRVRSRQGHHVQTLKADGHAGVAADRAEWEWTVEHDVPDLGLLEQTPMMQKLPQGLALEPVFSTDIDRTTRILKLDGGTVVEAAYDEGLIIAAEAQQPVRELELELREGNSAPLYRLALEIHTAAPLTIETDSKATRGYRLNSGEQPVAQTADDFSFKRTARAAEALQQILSTTLGHLLANQPAALAATPKVCIRCASRSGV
jgi:triphosphatase